MTVNYGSPHAIASHLAGTIQTLRPDPNGVNADVTVTIWRANPKRVYRRTRADRYGRFLFTDPPPDIYAVRITKPGYHPVEIKQLITPRGHDIVLRAQLLPANDLLVCQ